MISCRITKKLYDAQGMMPLEMNFAINPGERVAVYGPSGAGKTSLLRMLSGLMQPDSGSIQVNGSRWFDSDGRFNLKPRKRGLGFVFQDYALFPNMTVLENLEFARSSHKRGADLQQLLEVMELGELQNRKPDLLSGGQKQRVALARALASTPRILLLDEPFTALHAEMRIHLSDFLLKIQQESGFTLILITHDVGDIFKLCNRVLVLERGKILKNGAPEAVFLGNRPKPELALNGIILKIVKEGDMPMVILQVQSEIFEMEIKQDVINQISVGDRVSLLVDLQNRSQFQLRPHTTNSDKRF